MRRIRLVFLGLAMGLAIPMVWLVRGAFESVLYQQEIEHRTVAERLFDEMERPLAQFAANEDARPAAEYRFYRGTAVGEGGRSPLSHPPEASYVVGYFELDADGAFHSPLVPRDESRARTRGEWPPAATVRQAVARVEAIARRGLGAKRERLSELDWLAEKGQAPGTTKKSVSPAPAQPKAAAFDDEVKERLSKSDTYQVLSKLNRASQQRSAKTRDGAKRATVARKEAPVLGQARSNGSAAQFYRKATPSNGKDAWLAEVAASETISRPQAASEPQLSDFDAAESFAAPRARPQVVAEAEGLRGAGRLEARSLAPPRVPAAAPAPPDAAFDAAEEVSRDALAVPGGARRRDVAIAAPSEESAPADAERVIEVDPLHGELVDDAYVVLSRSVRVGAAARRQGVVVDVARLAAGVGDPVLLDSGLESRARLQFLPANRASSLSRGGGYVYRHRFAVPFDSLAASMTLPRLSDAEGPNYLYILSLLLLLAGAVGLVAVYRMVAVTVTFAERRNDFVAAVSHELKTPLTSIRMYGEMLRDGMVDSEAKQHEYYATITAETERLTRLINNVLEFSKLEQGTRDVNLVVGALGPVVEEAARLLEPHVREMGFELRVEVDSALPAVRFDRDALLQVVFNLVDNAVKYARDAEEKIITLQCRASEGGVELAVRDRGPGVSARHLSKIFEPFYRGERELTRTAKGTGIGLALVRGLAERMDAAVSGNNLSEGGFEVAISFRTATT